MAPKEIRGVIQKFKRALQDADFPSLRAVLFGSYARNEARPDSDIDICLISTAFKQHREQYRKKAVIIAFEIDPRIQVVLVDPHELKTNKLSPLWSHIRKESIAA
ncbi:MAG: nucleotidyltransferase domain-containing protein [Pseudomonadota bacterium]